MCNTEKMGRAASYKTFMATFQQNHSIAAAAAAMKIGKIQTMFLGNKTGRKHTNPMGEEGTWKSFEFCGDEKLGGGSSFLPSFLRLRKGSFDFVDGVDRQKGRRNLLF
jgi:hypothetical protein